ncbi:hypothetical protein EV2_005663 [Malus domestica]
MHTNKISIVKSNKDVEGNIIYVPKRKGELNDELQKKDVFLDHFKDDAPTKATKRYKFLTYIDFETLSVERRDGIKDDWDKSKEKLYELKHESAKSLWLKDLDALEIDLGRLRQLRVVEALEDVSDS